MAMYGRCQLGNVGREWAQYPHPSFCGLSAQVFDLVVPENASLWLKDSP